MAEKKESGGRKTQKVDINQWILTRVKTCFKHVKNDKFKKAFALDATICYQASLENHPIVFFMDSLGDATLPINSHQSKGRPLQLNSQRNGGISGCCLR